MIGILYVAAGGALGAVLRYALSQLPLAFPYATLLVNVLGCAAMGMIMAKYNAGIIHEQVRLLLAVGVLGGFTTFSAFSWELVQLTQRGEWISATIYASASLVLSFGGCMTGFMLMR